LTGKPEVLATYSAYIASRCLRLADYPAAVDALEDAERLLPAGDSFERQLVLDALQDALDTIPFEQGFQPHLESMRDRLLEEG